MLKDNVLDKLNEQLNLELQSAYVYYATAAYFEDKNLKGFANWMLVQAQEEVTHAHRIYNYIIDRGAKPRFDAADAPKQDWDSPLDAVKDAYDHECMVSERINECVGLAVKENDHSTNTMLQWFVNEQVEEEATADELVQRLKLVQDSPGALYMLDADLSKRSFGGGRNE